MLRAACFLTVLSLVSAGLVPRGFAVLVAAPAAATAPCADTQSPEICQPVTCKNMPSLAYDTCRKSCGWCDLAGPPCQNAAADVTCDAYAAANQCSMKSVSTNCAKSCGLCTGPPAPEPPVNPNCKNSAADATCDAYSAANQCGMQSVKINCQKSCGLC